MEIINLVFLFLAILFISLLILISKNLNKKPSSLWKKTTRLKLAELKDMLNHNTYQSNKLVIIEIDKLFDFVLKNRGLAGETMGERLKNARHLFDKQLYNQVWEAHKIRNTLAHEINYSISHETTKKSFNNLKEAIVKLI